jgi:MOSC domain-containing protein YiiM
MTARLLSINVGTPVQVDWAGDLGWTSIDKHQLEGPVAVHALGIEGDEIADKKHHGGTYQAVYAFAREDIDAWIERLGLEIRNGQFGENLTTSGIDVNEALIGEQWRIGTTVFQVADVRIPCNVFKNWMGVTGYDDTAWVKRFTIEARPGPYLQVVQPGEIRAGDAIEVVHKPDHDVSVTTMFRAFTTERELMVRLLDAQDDLPPKARAAAQKYASQRAGS